MGFVCCCGLGVSIMRRWVWRRVGWRSGMGGRGIFRGWGDDRIGYVWLYKESYVYLLVCKIFIVCCLLGFGWFRIVYWFYLEFGKSEMLYNFNWRGIFWVFVFGIFCFMVCFLVIFDVKFVVGIIVFLLVVVDIIVIMWWCGWNLFFED